MPKKWHYQTLVRGSLALRVSGFNASATVQQTIANTNIIDKINPSKLLRCHILPPNHCFIHVLLRSLRVETCQVWSEGGSEHIRVSENFERQILLVWGLFHNKFQGRITDPYDKAFTV